MEFIKNIKHEEVLNLASQVSAQDGQIGRASCRERV